MSLASLLVCRAPKTAPSALLPFTGGGEVPPMTPNVELSALGRDGVLQGMAFVPASTRHCIDKSARLTSISPF